MVVKGIIVIIDDMLMDSAVRMRVRDDMTLGVITLVVAVEQSMAIRITVVEVTVLSACVLRGR